LAHVEVLTPNPEGTLFFFKDRLAMQETERAGQSVYLRAYEDFYHHTLKITEAPQAGLGHFALRARSPQALERRVKAIEATGLGQGWGPGDRGRGPASRFTTPAAQRLELLWEVEYWQPPEDERSPLINRPQKRPLRGIPVRRLDHVNLLARDVAPNKRFLIETLGFQPRENIRLDDGNEA